MPENVPGIQTSTEWQIFKNWRQNQIGVRTCKGKFVRYVKFIENPR